MTNLLLMSLDMNKNLSRNENEEKSTDVDGATTPCEDDSSLPFLKSDKEYVQ